MDGGIGSDFDLLYFMGSVVFGKPEKLDGFMDKMTA
jgi:hypothetical protein